MKTTHLSTDRSHQDGNLYALRREGGCWQLTFEGRQSAFRQELGALYVACLLREPPREPIHAVALALKAREWLGQPAGRAEALEQQAMGLEDAACVRGLWRRQRELERVLEDRSEIEPVKAEALRELEAITERLRLSPWLSRHGAERCARAVAAAIKRLHTRLAGAMDGEGKPDEVLRAFARHLHAHLIAVSGGDGCVTYVPPKTVVWEVQCPKSNVQSLGAKGQSLESEVLGPESVVPGALDREPAAVGYLSRYLCVGYAVALMAAGCAGPRPLQGGRAVITSKPAGMVEQTLVQSENPAQAARQNQESIRVRTYTVPAGSRLEEVGVREPGTSRPRPDASHTAYGGPSALNPQPSTTFVLSTPMPVVEREETRAGTELGAAQKDMAREVGARLASLKGIVWVGAGLFVFGLASLVWPPLKVMIASVTTSAALMLGGVALMILPSMVVGNELLMLGGVGLAVGGWFLAHRHGELRGRVMRDA